MDKSKTENSEILVREDSTIQADIDFPTKRMLVKELLWKPGVATVIAIYAALGIASNAIQWVASPEFQARNQFIKLLADVRTQIGLMTVLTLVLIVFIIRSALGIIGRINIESKARLARLNSDLLLEKAKNLQPRIEGRIQAARLEPMIWAKLKKEAKDVWASCDVLIVAYFANLSPVQTFLRGFGLVVSIGGNIYEAIDAEDTRPLNWSLRRLTENRAGLNSSIGSSAPQGQPFDGFLHFRIMTGAFFDATDEVKVLKLFVRDSFGLSHEIPPEGDGIIHFPAGGPRMPHAGEDEGEQSPPQPSDQNDVSTPSS